MGAKTGAVLVVDGGLAGVQASRVLAELGFRVRVLRRPRHIRS
ncbi:MAG: hypothetical protein QW379_02700 [Thermoplasmata archaeon]